MTHAVAVTVKIEADSDITHRRKILDDSIIPEVTELPGFQKATWMNDGAGTGLCIVVFDTEEHAQAAVTPLTPPNGPAVFTTGIYEVEAEADR
jgi:hypothetical protein